MNHTFNIIGREENCPESYWILQHTTLFKFGGGSLTFSGYKNEADRYANHDKPLEQKTYQLDASDTEIWDDDSTKVLAYEYAKNTLDVPAPTEEAPNNMVSFFDNSEDVI